jgi:hypothetical protein
MTRRRIDDGRYRFEPTDDQRVSVRIMAACGMPQDFIVQQVPSTKSGKPIDLKTLRRAFRKELDSGKDVANALVAESLFKKAIGNGPQSVTAAVFWLRTQANWKAVDSVEMTGKDGSPFAPAGNQKVVLYLPDNGRGQPGETDDADEETESIRH